MDSYLYRRPKGRLQRLSSGLLLALIAEMTFGGPLGFRIFDLSLRKALILAFLSCFAVGFNHRNFLKAWQLGLITVLFFAVIGWGFSIPIVRGTNLSDSIDEMTPLAGLLLVFPMAKLIRQRGADYYLEFANRSLSILAVVVIVAWILATFFEAPEFAFALKLFYLQVSGDDFGTYIGPISDGSFRVMWITCVFFPFMLAYKNIGGLKIGWTTLYLSAIYASGTRSFLYASFLILAFTLVRNRPALAAVLAPILIVVVIASAQLFEGVRLFQIAADLDSESARSEQFYSLLRLFSDNPIFGSGFGAHADVLRSEVSPFSYELTYVALLAKLGIVGFSALAFVGIACVHAAISRCRTRAMEIVVLIISFVFITATNPYLINSVGIMIVSFMLAQVFSGTGSRMKGRAAFLRTQEDRAT